MKQIIPIIITAIALSACHKKEDNLPKECNNFYSLAHELGKNAPKEIMQKLDDEIQKIKNKWPTMDEAARKETTQDCQTAYGILKEQKEAIEKFHSEKK